MKMVAMFYSLAWKELNTVLGSRIFYPQSIPLGGSELETNFCVKKKRIQIYCSTKAA